MNTVYPTVQPTNSTCYIFTSCIRLCFSNKHSCGIEQTQMYATCFTHHTHTHVNTHTYSRTIHFIHPSKYHLRQKTHLTCAKAHPLHRAHTVCILPTRCKSAFPVWPPGLVQPFNSAWMCLARRILGFKRHRTSASSPAGSLGPLRNARQELPLVPCP